VSRCRLEQGRWCCPIQIHHYKKKWKQHDSDERYVIQELTFVKRPAHIVNAVWNGMHATA